MMELRRNDISLWLHSASADYGQQLGYQGAAFAAALSMA
jgi:hypothetical protein